MPVRNDTRNIPHIAMAVDRFIAVNRHTQKDIASLRSVLQGPAGKVPGNKAAGAALAKSELGGLRCSRVTDQQLLEWFADRHEELAYNTQRRGMSALRGFIKYCITQGWMDDRMIASFGALPKIDEGNRDWLKPETLVALLALVDHELHFDEYQRFAFYTFLSTGVRPSELIKLKRSSLDHRAQQLSVWGKGRGPGKFRKIPVPLTYCQRWDKHAKANTIAPDGWMFFRRAPRFDGAQSGTVTIEIDKKKHASAQPFRRMLAHNESDDRAKSLQELAQEHLLPEVAPNFQLTPRVIRRTFACLALIEQVRNPESGWDLRTLQEALGHTSLETTQLYLTDVHEYLGKHRSRFDAIEAARGAAAVWGHKAS